MYHLMESFYNSGKNAMTDNFFTMLNLVKNWKRNGLNLINIINRAKKRRQITLKRKEKLDYT